MASMMVEMKERRLVDQMASMMAEMKASMLAALRAFLKAGLTGAWLDESKAQRREDLTECSLVPQLAPH